MGAGKSRLTDASHRHCYAATEVLTLPGTRNQGMALAEIRLADCEDGWRASHGFGFSGGDNWGSWSPIFAASPVYPTREDAIGSESARLRQHIASREGAEPTKIRAWLDVLIPEQAELFA